MDVMEARKREEIEFHDRLREGQHEQRWSPEAEEGLKHDPMWANFKYYSIEEDSLEYRRQLIAARANGARILDYCCGNGLEALEVGRMGAKRVVGVDISPVSIENCNADARKAGLDGTVSFQVMDAEALEFADRDFDLIIEYGVLHHLDLDRAMAELARVLTPNGSVVCTETLAHNPFIAAYRRMTPHLRTAWEAEHILGRSAFDIARRHFGRIDMKFFHLLTIGAVPFRRTFFFKPLLSVLRAVDSVLLRIPWVRWQAWQVVFVMSEPKSVSPNGPARS